MFHFLLFFVDFFIFVDSHLNVLDRFIAQRDKSKMIRSDKGRMFVGEAKPFQEL
jgi:hypothetical protein